MNSMLNTTGPCCLLCQVVIFVILIRALHEGLALLHLGAIFVLGVQYCQDCAHLPPNAAVHAAVHAVCSCSLFMQRMRGAQLIGQRSAEDYAAAMHISVDEPINILGQHAKLWVSTAEWILTPL